MKPSDIRIELLREHIALRAQLGEVLRRAEERERFDEELARLGRDLRNHTKHEEDVLRLVLPELPSWGHARTAIFLAEHAKEHAALLAAFAAVGGASDVHAALMVLVDTLLGHMVDEERTWLADAVVADAAEPRAAAAVSPVRGP